MDCEGFGGESKRIEWEATRQTSTERNGRVFSRRVDDSRGGLKRRSSKEAAEGVGLPHAVKQYNEGAQGPSQAKCVCIYVYMYVRSSDGQEAEKVGRWW